MCWVVHLDKKVLSEKPQIDGHNDGDYGGKNDYALSPPFVVSLICEVGDDLHKHYSTEETSKFIIEGWYGPDFAHAMKVSTIGWANMQPKEKVCWTRLADPAHFRNKQFLKFSIVWMQLRTLSGAKSAAASSSVGAAAPILIWRYW